MTEKVQLGNGFDCVLTVKGEQIDLGESLINEIRSKFVTLCIDHKYNPTTALITVKKDHGIFNINIHAHLNHVDYHSHGEDADVYKALSHSLHMWSHNVSK